MKIIAKTYFANQNLVVYNSNTGNISVFNSGAIDLLNNIEDVDEEILYYLLKNNYVETDFSETFKSKTVSEFDESMLIIHFASHIEVSEIINRVIDLTKDIYISNIILHIPVSANHSQYKYLYDFCSTLAGKVKVIIYTYKMLISKDWIWLRGIQDLLLVYNDDSCAIECGTCAQSWNITIEVPISNKSISNLIEIATIFDTFSIDYYFNFLPTTYLDVDFQMADADIVNSFIQRIIDLDALLLKDIIVKSIYKKPDNYCCLFDNGIGPSSEIILINHKRCNNCQETNACLKCEVSDFCRYKCRISNLKICSLKDIITSLFVQ